MELHEAKMALELYEDNGGGLHIREVDTGYMYHNLDLVPDPDANEDARAILSGESDQWVGIAIDKDASIIDHPETILIARFTVALDRWGVVSSQVGRSGRRYLGLRGEWTSDEADDH